MATSSYDGEASPLSRDVAGKDFLQTVGRTLLLLDKVPPANTSYPVLLLVEIEMSPLLLPACLLKT